MRAKRRAAGRGRQVRCGDMEGARGCVQGRGDSEKGAEGRKHVKGASYYRQGGKKVTSAHLLEGFST